VVAQSVPDTGPSELFVSGTDGASFTDAQVMLALSLLTYRRFHDLRPWRLNRRMLRASVEEGLGTLEPLREQWDLAWGPAAYRAPFTAFDESVAFVAKHRLHPETYVIAIRGTNPVSIFDWFTGDLWAARQIKWPLRTDDHGDQAAVSLSTAIGVNALRAMRSSVPPDGPLGAAWRFTDQDVGDRVRGLVATAVVPVWRVLDAATGALGLPLHRRLRALARMHRDLPVDDPEVRVCHAIGMWRSDLRKRLLRDLDLVFETVGDDLQFEAIKVLEGMPLFRLPYFEGVTLPDFLGTVVEMADGPVTLHVTGHSKGGALAPALAMWLADTQGTEGVRERYRWDPTHKATVHCCAFAGPTPGNRAFAAHLDRVLGDRHRRLYNPLDIVPHAWAVRPEPGASGLYLEHVPNIYGDRVHHIGALDDLAEYVVETMQPLEYAHAESGAVAVPAEVHPERLLYTEQMAFQHVDAYVAGLGLEPYMGTLDFMNPFR
jgi:hypothetical protein